MEERRRARSSAVGGLTLLVGGTSVAAVAGGAQSAFSSAALGLLALALGHTLLDEIKRQAGRRSPGGWTRHDTVNTLLLGWGAAIALITAGLDGPPDRIRVVAGALTIGYAAACCRFALLRRRTLSARHRGLTTPVAASPPTATGPPNATGPPAAADPPNAAADPPGSELGARNLSG